MAVKVSLSAVAKAAGVHPATASHVLNGNAAARISASTQERVRSAAESLGYVPNRAARALSTGKTYAIALQDFDLSSPYSSIVAKELQSLVVTDGYDLVVCMVNRRMGALAANVDGVIALDHGPHTQVSRVDGPTVAMGVFAPMDVDACLIDYGPGLRMGLDSLWSAGRRRIAFVSGTDHLGEGDPRECAYLGFCEDRGLRPAVLTCAKDSRQDGYETVRAQATGGYDALVCRNDMLAVGALRALRESGLDVPGDVAVIGCDGLEESAFADPPLSSVVAPIRQACATAWSLLKRRMQDPNSNIERVSLATRFDPRGTTPHKEITENP